MKFNPLRDWHFTLSMETPFEQVTVFLNCLDILGSKNSSYMALEAAISQLKLLDNYFFIYALPQLLRAKNNRKDKKEITMVNELILFSYQKVEFKFINEIQEEGNLLKNINNFINNNLYKM